MALEGYIDGGERIIRQFSDKGVPSRWLPPATAANHATAAPSKSPAAVMNPTTTALRRAFLMAVVVLSKKSVTRASASGPVRPVRVATMQTT